MKNIRSLMTLLIGLISSLGLVSCLPEKPEPIQKHPLQFYAAIPILAGNLLSQVKGNQGILSGLGETTLVVDPFIEASSGEVVKVSRQIEDIFIAKAQQDFKNMTMTRMTPENLVQANYLVSGVLLFDNFQSDNSRDEKKYYHVSSSIVDLKTGKIVANSDVWLSDTQLDNLPVLDSPLLTKDKRAESLVKTATKPVGELAEKEYYDSLETQALLAEAETAYEKSDYQTALTLFSTAAKREDGRVMKTYAGLYRTNLKLGDNYAAEQAFGELVAIGMAEDNLSAKFLFDVNSTDFVPKSNLRREYDLWLRQIGQHFARGNRCLHIIGHSSRTGKREYNLKLSKQRAQSIQERLRSDFQQVMQKSVALGKGFDECINCSGTDDAKDAVDRRVEFKIIDCHQI
jgi:outer membrane protein OmpA-like peptidoglycan-associated protein